MKTFKISLIVLITILTFKSVNAQPCNIKPDDLPELKNKTLIVEKQNKKLSTWFLDFWTFNKKIEFKTREECLKIPKEQQERYLVLGCFYEEMHYNNDYDGKRTLSSHSLRMIGLVRLEDYKKTTKNNINSVVIAVYTPDENSINEIKVSETKLTIKILANQLKTIEKESLKKYKTYEFAKDQTDINCEKIQTKEIYIDKAFLKAPSDISLLKNNKKFTVNITETEQIDEKIENDEDVLIAYSSPFGIQGANDVLVYTHFFVNAKDGVFYYESGRSQFTMPGIYFRKELFKDIIECSK